MSKARLVITAVEIEGITQAEAARRYGVSKGWVSKLVARYRAEGDTALEPRSRAPKSHPAATPAATVDLVVGLRKQLTDAGLDAGAHGPRRLVHAALPAGRAGVGHPAGGARARR